MQRNQVDSNPSADCSNGFHAGTIEYVKNSYRDQKNHIIIVKIDPADVVSVPTSDTNKIRVCKYEVIGEYKDDLTASVYEASACGISEVPPEEDFDEEEVKAFLGDEDEDDDEDDDYAVCDGCGYFNIECVCEDE